MRAIAAIALVVALGACAPAQLQAPAPVAGSQPPDGRPS
jgi:hypothetical protein